MNSKINKFIGVVTLLLALSTENTNAQVGMPTNNPQRNAQLDLNGANSQNNKGLLLPRVSLVATDNVAPLIGTVLSGMKVYNLATAGTGATAVTPGEYYYDGTKWVRIAAEGSASSGGAEPWYDVTTKAGATANTQNIYQMGKVGIGKNNPQAQLDVAADALINGVTVGRGGASEKTSTAVGNNALKSITSGSNNTAMGYESLTSCTTGNSNVGVGVALMDLTTGGVNTGIGFGTLNGLVTGSGNTAVGSFSLNSAKGIGNTAIGSDSGLGQKNGDFNIMIGRNANVPDINGSNQMSIGNLIYGTGMSTTSKYMGNIGIGTDNIGNRLQVKGDIGVSSTGNPVSSNVVIGTASENGTYISGGQVGIQSTLQNLLLSKPAGITTQGWGAYFLDFRVAGNSVGGIAYSGGGTAVIAVSDKRLKENIVSTHYGLSDVMKIGIFDYNYKTDTEKTLNTGVMAQDLYKVIPSAVKVGGNDAQTNPWAVDYAKLIPILIKGMQEQQQNMNTQQAEIEALKKEVKMLKSK